MSNLLKPSDRVQQLKKRFTSQELIVAYSPAALQKKHLNTTLAEAIGSRVMTLAEIHQAYGLETVQLYIHSWLLQLNLFLNRREPMSDDQLEETSLLLYRKAHQLNLAELTLFFSSVKMGDYGEIAGYLDGTKILSYLSQFLSKRSEAQARLLRANEQRNSLSMAEASASLMKLMREQRPELYEELKDSINKASVRG